MFAEERQRKISQMISDRGAVRMNELTGLFGVSIETIRRDLLELESRNVLRRVHGGAMRIPGKGENLTINERGVKNREGKAELSGYAAWLIQEGDTIMVDSGSTAIEFAKMLTERFDRLTVITQSLDVFEILRKKEGYTLYLCTGKYLQKENAFCGTWALQMLDSFHAGTAFLFPAAISLQYGIMDYNEDLYHVQKKMIRQADRVVYLADSRKFERTGLLKLAEVKEGDIVVTDSALSDEICDIYRENRVQLIRSEKKEN